MKQGISPHIKQEKIIGLAAAIVLHSAVLYFLMSYHIIPPPSEALTVFVNYVNTAAPAKITAPPEQKRSPAENVSETPKTVTPPAPQILTSTAPVLSPVEPVAPPPPVVKTVPLPTPVNAPVMVRPVQASPPATGGMPMGQPVLQSGELSVSCSERTAPSYPKQSMQRGEQGKTVLLVELDELGRVANVDVKTKSGFPRLDEAAIAAVKTWRCIPAKRNGVSVRSVALQPFNFTLKGR
jgi:protein TonB